jgi:hypothetical protein
VPPQLGPGFRSSPLRAAACAYSKALPFGDLARGVIGVSNAADPALMRSRSCRFAAYRSTTGGPGKVPTCGWPGKARTGEASQGWLGHRSIRCTAAPNRFKDFWRGLAANRPCSSQDGISVRSRDHHRSSLVQLSLSSFEVTAPHPPEQGDRCERGQRVEASDENEHCGPAPCLIL